MFPSSVNSDIEELDFNLNLQRNANAKGMNQGEPPQYSLRNFGAFSHTNFADFCKLNI